MLNRIIFTLFVIGAVSCSSLQPKNANPRSIGFSDLQKIKMGQSHSSDLKKEFGKPTETIAEEGGKEIWVYKDYVYDSFSDRAKFQIDSKSGVVMSVIWSPDKAIANENK